MPLLGRLSDDAPDNGHRDEKQPPADVSPIVPGRPGRPSFSLEALRERVERQFHEETAHRADILLELDTEEKRRALLGEVTGYVLGVEAISLSAEERAHLIDRVYSNLFTFGPLDAFFDDDTVTEITVNGPYEVHMRRGLGPMEAVSAAFDDRVHLARIVGRVVTTGGATLSEDAPFLEVGVVIKGRAARISLVAPPISPEHNLTIRLHPSQPVTLHDLHTRWRAVPPQAAELLRAILRAGHGLLLVGDVGQGKTTLAGALARELGEETRLLAVERAAELVLPEGAKSRAPVAPGPDEPGRDFAATIGAALDEAPDWLLIDELRGDESAAIWAALMRADPPRYLWVFRGDPRPDRLRSALSMLVRKTQQAVPQDTLAGALARHLPFVAAFRRGSGPSRLGYVAETVVEGAGEDATLVFRTLLSDQDGGWIVTENRPTRPLDLPADFWE